MVRATLRALPRRTRSGRCGRARAGRLPVGAALGRRGRHGPDRLRGQYVRANLDPSDRYVQSLPGTGRYRLAPGRTGFANLAVAGDWTACGSRRRLHRGRHPLGRPGGPRHPAGDGRRPARGPGGVTAGADARRAAGPGRRRAALRAVLGRRGRGPVRRDRRPRAIAARPRRPAAAAATAGRRRRPAGDGVAATCSTPPPPARDRAPRGTRRRTTLVLPPAGPGLDSEAALWIHNTTSSPAPGVELHATALLSTTGADAIPADAVSLVPGRVDLVPARDQPRGPAAGARAGGPGRRASTTGMVVTTAAPAEPMALRLEVRGP